MNGNTSQHMPEDITIENAKKWLIGVLEEFDESNFITMRIYSHLSGEALYSMIQDVLLKSSLDMFVTDLSRYGKSIVMVAKITAH